MLKVNYERHKHNISIKYAISGILFTIKNHHNFTLHLIFFVIAIIASVIYKITLTEFLIVLVVSSVVLTAELFNTALEALADDVSDGNIKELIKVCKDSSAGAVLISAIFAGMIALIIFGPRVLTTFLELTFYIH